eukprot:2293183-Amphidinium_carterae.1
MNRCTYFYFKYCSLFWKVVESKVAARDHRSEEDLILHCKDPPCMLRSPVDSDTVIASGSEAYNQADMMLD